MKNPIYTLFVVLMVAFGIFWSGVVTHELFHVATGHDTRDLCVTFGDGDYKDYSPSNGNSIAYVVNGGGSEFHAYTISIITWISFALFALFAIHKTLGEK